MAGTMFKICIGSLLICSSICISRADASESNVSQNYSFAIDYKNDQFLLDGKPFRYVSGSFHYFRAPNQNWREILRKMRAAGLNAVSTYVEWRLHEPQPGQWYWDGDANIVEFVKVAQEEDLLVILRPGPYICAERDLGGLPYWLLKLVPDIKIRTNDKRYLLYAENFLNQILRKIKPYLRGKGGPIIMVQIENEYGSFYSCNDEYKQKMYEIFDRHVRQDAILFTTDGPTQSKLKCGSIPGVYATVDFGPDENVTTAFKIMRNYSPKGPLVNSEFYSGWLTHWGEKLSKRKTETMVKTLDDMLGYNASINLYMFYGGTNFGFTSGANTNTSYWPQITSYDYDAPLTEAGDPTSKYFEIRKTISKYLPLPRIKVPTVAPKENYGVVPMTPKLDLFTEESRTTFGTQQRLFSKPPTFEYLGLPHWLVLYETSLPTSEVDSNKKLEAETKDRALVYLDDKLTGVLSRMDKTDSLSLPSYGGKQMKLLVENMGRINYGNIDVEDFKGISNVKINDKVIESWRVTGFQLSSLVIDNFKIEKTSAQSGRLENGPQFLVGHFDVEGIPLSTYLNTDGWGKGAAYVNGHNLGRYWPSLGPQVTLYVPAAYLKQGRNYLVLLELEYVPGKREIKLQATPILDKPIVNKLEETSCPSY